MAGPVAIATTNHPKFAFMEHEYTRHHHLYPGGVFRFLYQHQPGTGANAAVMFLDDPDELHAAKDIPPMLSFCFSGPFIHAVNISVVIR